MWLVIKNIYKNGLTFEQTVNTCIYFKIINANLLQYPLNSDLSFTKLFKMFHIYSDTCMNSACVN